LRLFKNLSFMKTTNLEIINKKGPKLQAYLDVPAK
jgi:hypothetical protein